MVEIILKKISPPLYQALGIYLPLITTNCAVLGVALLVHTKEYNLLESVVYGISIAVGFGFAMVLFAGIREHTGTYGNAKRHERRAYCAGYCRHFILGIYGLQRPGEIMDNESVIYFRDVPDLSAGYDGFFRCIP